MVYSHVILLTPKREATPDVLLYHAVRSIQDLISHILAGKTAMSNRIVLLLGFTLLTVNLCLAQGLQDTTAHGDFYKMIGLIQKMMQGAPYEEVKPYASIEAMVISGDTTRHLLEVLKAKDRAAILREDSTRQGIQIIARSNKAEDAIYVVLKTVNAKKEDPRWHSLVLYKEGDTGWQVYLWHVGE